MESDDGAVAGVGEEEGAVLTIVHKAVFGENGRRECVLAEVKA